MDTNCNSDADGKDMTCRGHRLNSFTHNSFSSDDIPDRCRYDYEDFVNGDLTMAPPTSDTAFRKSRSVIHLTANPASPTESNEGLLPSTLGCQKKATSTIQIPIVASTITLTIPTPTAVINALKSENFASIYLHRIFHHCKVNSLSFQPPSLS